MGIKFDNLSQFGDRKRTITIVIEHSRDVRRIGPHEIKPSETFEVNPDERGHVLNWLGEQQVPFAHESESAWVRTVGDRTLSISNLRAFTRPERKWIRRKGETLLGLHVSFTPITKERLG